MWYCFGIAKCQQLTTKKLFIQSLIGSKYSLNIDKWMVGLWGCDPKCRQWYFYADSNFKRTKSVKKEKFRQSESETAGTYIYLSIFICIFSLTLPYLYVSSCVVQPRLRPLLIAAISAASNGIKQSIELHRKSCAQICRASFNIYTQVRKFAMERVASLII